MGASGAVGGQAPAFLPTPYTSLASLPTPYTSLASLPTTYTSLASLPALPYTSLAQHTALAIDTHAIPAGDRTCMVVDMSENISIYNGVGNVRFCWRH